MRVPTTQEFDAILQSLPQAPQNLAAINALLSLRNESRVERQPYNFNVTFSAVVAGTTAPVGSFLVDTSAPFMLVSQQYQATVNPNVAQTVSTASRPNMLVQIQDQSSNRNWQNSGTPVGSIFGTAMQPYFLPQPRLIPANTTVLVTVNNYDAAQTTDLILTFSGWRYYAVN